MKLILIGNCVYLPIIDTNKYVAGDISGNVYFNQIYTLEEIKEYHKESTSELKEVKHLHELTKTWGSRN